MTTSLILTAQEWRYAICGEGEPGELCEKGLAKRDDNDCVVIGPELRAIAEEYGAAAPEEVEGDATALRGERFCMLIESYPLIKDTLKITLLKDAIELEEALENRRECK